MLNYNDILKALSKSKFRSHFVLSEKDKMYVQEKTLPVIRKHAIDFVKTRLAPKYPKNDGKQTPMRGHPVFIAFHATATCCRSCLAKWHHIPKYHELTKEEENYIVDLIMVWITKEMEKRN